MDKILRAGRVKARTAASVRDAWLVQMVKEHMRGNDVLS